MNPSRAAISALGVIALCAVILSGCTGPGEPGPSLEVTPFPPMTVTPHSPTTPELPGSATSVIDGNNRFALELYEHLANDPENREENLFFSPFSISSALAITYEGARGTTADEIRSVFHFPENQSAMRSGFFEIIARVNSNANPYVLKTANALWAEKTHPFHPDYPGIADRYYGAKTTTLDFVNAPEDSRVIINKWVEEKTGDRIKDLIPPGAIDPSTALVITNAIYFKGTWVKQFDPEKTRDADFVTGNGTTIRVPMMQRTDDAAIFRYAETEKFQVLEMPYESGGGTGLSMLVVLPRENDIAGITQSLDIGTLQEMRQSLALRVVRVYFPKFRIETKYWLCHKIG